MGGAGVCGLKLHPAQVQSPMGWGRPSLSVQLSSEMNTSPWRLSLEKNVSSGPAELTLNF